MTKIILDTNVLIRYFKGDEPFSDAIEEADSVIMHPVAYAEFIAGADEKTAGGKALRRKIQEFLDAPAVSVVTVTLTTGIYYSKIYRYLKSAGTMIPRNDIWLAASALEGGYELATHDGHFAQIPMLQLTESRVG